MFLKNIGNLSAMMKATSGQKGTIICQTRFPTKLHSKSWKDIYTLLDFDYLLVLQIQILGFILKSQK